MGTDLRYAWRRLVHHPLTTGVVLALLALGIGASAAIFTLVHSVLLRPLPFPDAGQLVLAWQKERQHPQLTAVSPPNFYDWQEQATSFEHLAAYGTFGANLVGNGGEPERIRISPVTADFFAVLGIETQIGRWIAAADFEQGPADVAVLSHGLWRGRFGGDPEIVGKTVDLDGVRYSVVGVMPPGFGFPERETAVWLPSGLPRDREESVAGAPYRAFRVLSVVGRLASGVEAAAADAELATLARQLEEAYPEANKDQEAVVTSLMDQVVGTAKPALLVLSGAVGLVLLLAVANIANLLLVQAAGRESEMAIRGALGASGKRLARQLFAEYLMLAVVGGVLGIALARGLVSLILAVAGDAVPRSHEVTLDSTVLLVTLAIAVLTGLGFGLVPVFHARRTDLIEALRSGSREIGKARVRRAHAALVIVEFALAVPLLIGGGLLARSFHRLETVNPGFVADNVWAFEVTLSRSYAEPHQWRSFHEGLLERVRSLPGVGAASIALQAPILGHDVDRTPVTLEGDLATVGDHRMARHHLVGEGYFETLAIPLLRGRAFDERDRADQPGVAIVNEAMARLFWPGESPIGQRLTHEMQLIPDEPVDREVVGVVADVRHFELASAAEPQLYLPAAQSAWFRMTYLVRTPLGGRELLAAVRQQVRQVAPELPVAEVVALPDAVARSIGQPRLQRMLLVTFAAAAIILAAIGLYGVMAYSVSQRRHELGLRMALGATAGDLVRLILGRGLALTSIGVAAGLAAGVVLSRLLASQLFEVRVLDPAVYLGSVLLVLGVGLLATLVPARRTVGVHPARALRSE